MLFCIYPFQFQIKVILSPISPYMHSYVHLAYIEWYMFQNNKNELIKFETVFTDVKVPLNKSV